MVGNDLKTMEAKRAEMEVKRAEELKAMEAKRAEMEVKRAEELKAIEAKRATVQEEMKQARISQLEKEIERLKNNL